MNSAQDPESSQPAETERIPFLLSRHLDGDLTFEESSQLAALQQTDADRAYLSAMTDLRDQLKALPVKRVSESFAISVQDAIHKPSTTVSAGSALNTHRGRIVRGIVAVSVAACAAALMLFLRSPDAERADVTALVALSGEGPAAGRAAMVISPAAAAVDEESAKNETASEAKPPADSAADQTVIAQREEMRPFIETDKWSIVVVTVNSKDREEVMRILERTMAKNGMEIKSVVGNGHHDARFGVLFTSTGANDNALIESVISETDAKSADWNPESVADSTSESLIRRMQESLKTPTLSELHFGQVYMALLKSAKSDDTASQPLVTQHNALKEASSPSAAAGKAAVSPNEVATDLSSRKTPVLVVFEFTSQAAENI